MNKLLKALCIRVMISKYSQLTFNDSLVTGKASKEFEY